MNINTEKVTKTTGPEDFFGDMFRGMPPGFERFFEPFQRDKRRPNTNRQRSLGSGFLISADGYIVTNFHVVDGADEGRVKVAVFRKTKEESLSFDFPDGYSVKADALRPRITPARKEGIYIADKINKLVGHEYIVLEAENLAIPYDEYLALTARFVASVD